MLLEKACYHFGHDYMIVDKYEEVLPFPDNFNPGFDVPESQTIYSCECKNCGCQTSFPNKIINNFRINQDRIDLYSDDVERLKMSNSQFGKNQRLLMPSEY